MDNATPDHACHNLAHLEIQFLGFINETGTIGRLQQLAGPFLDQCLACIVRVTRASTPQVQDRFLDKVYETYPTLNASNIHHLRTLGEVSSSIGRPPPILLISEGLEKSGTTAMASGRVMDAWPGEQGVEKVFIKVFRKYPDTNMTEAKKLLWGRVVIWGRLSHPNVTGFRGVNASVFNRLALVFDHAQHGNIIQYLASNPNASRPALLLQIAIGLRYLHGLGLSHGNLKGANVVVDGVGQVRLSDCGLASINWDIQIPDTESDVGNTRWLAPEIIKPSPEVQGILESRPADIFAFAMLAIEIFTGRIPFPEEHNDRTVVRRIYSGDRPVYPQNALEVGLTTPIWEFLQRCWDTNPMKRPTIDEVVERWKGFLENNNERDPTPPPAEAEVLPVRNLRRAKNLLKKLLCLR